MSDDKFEDFAADSNKIHEMIESKGSNYSFCVVVSSLIKVALYDRLSEDEFDERLSKISKTYRYLARSSSSIGECDCDDE